MVSDGTDLVAFFDESRKPLRSRKTGKTDESEWHYVMGCAVGFSGELAGCRERLLKIESSLGFKLHYQDLRKPSRRVAAVGALVGLADWDGYVFETSSPIGSSGGAEHKARASQLEQAFTFLNEMGIRRVVLDTRAKRDGGRALDEKDIAVREKLHQQGRVAEDFRIEHLGTRSEPMLKIPDVIAGSRTDLLCAKDESIFPRLAHRAFVPLPEIYP